MSHIPYRVGVRQYLILGAFIQSPDGKMTYRQILDFVNLHRLNITVPSTIKSLIDRGCIEKTFSVNQYQLTEYGALALCAKSKRADVRHLPLVKPVRRVRSSAT